MRKLNSLCKHSAYLHWLQTSFWKKAIFWKWRLILWNYFLIFLISNLRDIESKSYWFIKDILLYYPIILFIYFRYPSSASFSFCDSISPVPLYIDIKKNSKWKKKNSEDNLFTMIPTFTPARGSCSLPDPQIQPPTLARSIHPWPWPQWGSRSPISIVPGQEMQDQLRSSLSVRLP